jgi:serine protease AprX
MIQTYIGVSCRRLLYLFFFFIGSQVVLGQADITSRYWIFFQDKHGCTFDPYSYFSPEALLRRQREGLSLQDSTDFPLNANYLTEVIKSSTNCVGQSRWFNAVVSDLNLEQFEKIRAFPFVIHTARVDQLEVKPCHQKIDEKLESLLVAQTEVLQYPQFADKKLDGSGITIAVFDAGFSGFINNPHLQHLIDNKQIKATFNFVTERNFVFDYHDHGTMVTSCIAGKTETSPMGCATGAKFLLARTEQTKSESQIEEYNWVRSLEWADQQGADIINSSLGYTHQLYKRNDMTGHSHMMAKAANMAFSKGMLIVNSAGNEGDDWWEIVAGPADSDSILTVGGIEPLNGMHHPQSSYGPNTSGGLKPNVSAFFSAIVTKNGRLIKADGTSFSAPLVAGFAACVWQLHPDWTVQRLFQEIQKSGHLYPYYDYAHGYGVPQASYFTAANKTNEKQFDFTYDKEVDRYYIKLCKPSANMQRDAQVAQSNLFNYVYYHLCDEMGKLLTYHVIMPDEFEGAQLEMSNCDDCIVRVHYKGQTTETTRNQIRLQYNKTNAED